MDRQVPLAFCKLAELGNRLGAGPLNKHPACWEYRIDERWEIAFNGHKEPKACSTGEEVLPYSCYVKYNGWPAGILDPGGGIIAAGEGANENTFIDAIEAAIMRLSH